MIVAQRLLAYPDHHASLLVKALDLGDGSFRRNVVKVVRSVALLVAFSITRDTEAFR